MAAFVAFEARVSNPIMPLRILSERSLVASNLVRGFLVTGAFSTFFLGALYLEHVRGFDAVQIGLAFLAMSVALAAMSAGISARLVDAVRAQADPGRRDRERRRRAADLLAGRRATPRTSP